MKSLSCIANVWPLVLETLKRPLSGVFAKLLMKFFLIHNLNFSGN